MPNMECVVNYVELKAIVEDVCSAANVEFSRQDKCTGQKWTLCDGKRTIASVDLVDDTIAFTIHSLKSNEAYIRLKEYIENLDSVRAVIQIAGYHTQPDQLIDRLIKGSFLKTVQRFDQDCLLERLSEFQELISKEFHEFSITGRLHGVKLEIDKIELKPNVLLVSLDADAINERQPWLHHACDSPTILDYSNSNVEVVLKEAYAITPHSVLSYFNVANKAFSELRLRLEEVVRAIKLYRNGDYELYPVTYYSPLYDGFQSRPNEPKHICPFNNVVLGEVDVEGLKKAFQIVKNVISQDGVLSRSFSRFLIGSSERVPEERIVDFVIAWESLLLTVNGNSIQSELSYRFSLNGAAMLSNMDDSLEFTDALSLMKGSYRIRSKIVHGGRTDSLHKDMTTLGFENLSDLNIRLSELYQKVVYWLANLKKEERPYHAPFGWELLLRKKD